MKTVAILGRQPKLGIAELESLYGAESLLPYGRHACLLNTEPGEVNFDRLGGTVRLGLIISELPNNWQRIEEAIISAAKAHGSSIDGKMTFGISVFGMDIPAKKIAKTALLTKKAIKAEGNSVRMVPHDGTELNSATVLYNKLTAENGLELIVVSDGKTARLAKTIRIQDIDAYAARDQKRPMRDAKVGMLPPKLAQIIINLGVGSLKSQAPMTKQVTSTNDQKSGAVRILDAFCGTGVVLQEAMLMDYDIYGTDLEPRMIEYSITNLQWLDQKFPNVGNYRRIEVGDATTFAWNDPDKINVVAGETYLGQPLSTLPPGDQLSKIMQEVNALHHKFLENIGSQIRPGTRLCLAIPTWRGKREFLHLSALDYLSDLGYTRQRFEHVTTEDLIYHREGQVVGRELLVLVKN